MRSSLVIEHISPIFLVRKLIFMEFTFLSKKTPFYKRKAIFWQVEEAEN